MRKETAIATLYVKCRMSTCRRQRHGMRLPSYGSTGPGRRICSKAYCLHSAGRRYRWETRTGNSRTTARISSREAAQPSGNRISRRAAPNSGIATRTSRSETIGRADRHPKEDLNRTVRGIPRRVARGRNKAARRVNPAKVAATRRADLNQGAHKADLNRAAQSAAVPTADPYERPGRRLRSAAARSRMIASRLPQRHDRLDLHCASRREIAGVIGTAIDH
jgi:hypothetical protein